MMLRHSFGLTAEAEAVEQAVGQVLADGLRTADIAGSAPSITTAAMGRAVLQKVFAHGTGR
jgi:3-isopropylmalate dehydrogenase